MKYQYEEKAKEWVQWCGENIKRFEEEANKEANSLEEAVEANQKLRKFICEEKPIRFVGRGGSRGSLRRYYRKSN